MRLPIAREGWPFILPLFGMAVLGLAIMPGGGWVLLALTGFVGVGVGDPAGMTSGAARLKPTMKP